jgi:hypothetical protein
LISEAVRLGSDGVTRTRPNSSLSRRQREAPHSVYAALRSPARRLDREASEVLRRLPAHDFSRVRIHDGADADASARAIGASAYAVGPELVFASGRYRPQTTAGAALLAHELTHVAQVGTCRPSGPLWLGAPDDVSETEGASSAAPTQADPNVVRRAPDGASTAPVATAVPMREFVSETGERVKVTEAEYAARVSEAKTRVADSLRRVKDRAENYRSTHADFMKNIHGEAESTWDVIKHPSKAIAIAVDMRAGVTPPYVGMWTQSIRFADDGLAAIKNSDLRSAAIDLRTANASFEESVHAWNTYMDQIQQGGQKLIGELGVVRDVSFAIAITAAVTIAAPAVAGLAASGSTALGATGTGGAILTTTGTALGTGAVGALGGGTLRAGSEALAQKAVLGHVDKKAVWEEGKRGAREGFVSGVTAGTAKGLDRVLGAGGGVASHIARRAVIEGTANTVGGASSAALEGKSGTEIAKAGARGLLTGALSSPLGGAQASLAGAGRPYSAKALEVGGSMLIGGGVALASGAKGDEAFHEALIAGTSTLALSGARAPGDPAPKQPAVPEHARAPAAGSGLSAPAAEGAAPGAPAPTSPSLAPELEAHAPGAVTGSSAVSEQPVVPASKLPESPEPGAATPTATPAAAPRDQHAVSIPKLEAPEVSPGSTATTTDPKSPMTTAPSTQIPGGAPPTATGPTAMPKPSAAARTPQARAADYVQSHGGRLQDPDGALVETMRRGADPLLRTQARAATPELATIERYLDPSFRDPGGRTVRRMIAVGSSAAGRSPDFVVEYSDGFRERVEVRTITSAPRGRVTGTDPRTSLADATMSRPVRQTDIERAILGKGEDLPGKPSQLTVPHAAAPPGGALSLHIHSPTPGTDAMVQGAIQAAAPRLSPNVRRIEVRFFERASPSEPMLSRTVVYIRQPNGTYALSAP